MAKNQVDSPRKVLRPLFVMGLFWLGMGLFIYIAAFFVQANNYVSRTRGIITDIVAGSILTLIGIFCLYRGRKGKIHEEIGNDS